MKNISYVFLAGSLILVPAANADVSITAFGDATGYDIIGAQASSFFTTSVVKTFVLDSDDQYGTDGYLIFGGDNNNVNGADYGDTARYAESVPTFIDSFTVATGDTVLRNNSSQTPMDDPDAAVNGTDFAFSGYLMNNSSSGEQTMLQFGVTDSAAMSFRFGVIAGNESGTNLDPAALRLSFSDGTTANIASLETLSGTDPTSGIGMAFFDVTLDASTTGIFTLLTTEGGGNPTIGGITFDVIPEPSSYALLTGCLAVCVVMLRRRRA
ncbi:MAG: PEP-CTERM sorting domain-containing protein [Opitutaceae bacterium]